MLAPTPVHVLIIEEAVADAELMVAELRRAGFAPDWRRVVTEASQPRFERGSSSRSSRRNRPATGRGSGSRSASASWSGTEA